MCSDERLHAKTSTCVRYVEQFLRHLKNEKLTKLMVLLAGTMIFELAVKNDTESTYVLF